MPAFAKVEVIVWLTKYIFNMCIENNSKKNPTDYKTSQNKVNFWQQFGVQIKPVRRPWVRKYGYSMEILLELVPSEMPFIHSWPMHCQNHTRAPEAVSLIFLAHP